MDAGEPYVIRQRIPREGTTTFHDAIFGDPPLRLDIGGHGAAHIGALIVVQLTLGQRLINDVGGTLIYAFPEKSNE